MAKQDKSSKQEETSDNGKEDERHVKENEEVGTDEDREDKKLGSRRYRHIYTQTIPELTPNWTSWSSHKWQHSR